MYEQNQWISLYLHQCLLNFQLTEVGSGVTSGQYHVW